MADLAAEVRRRLPGATCTDEGHRTVVRLRGSSVAVDATVVALTPAWALADEVERLLRAMRAPPAP
jgi:hypothetical protein